MIYLFPGGNGGVAAGLIYGNAWLGCPFCINVVSVDDELPVLYEGIRETVSQIGEITGISIEGIRGKATISWMITEAAAGEQYA